MLALVLYAALAGGPCNYITKCASMPCNCTGPTGTVRLALPPQIHVLAGGTVTLYGDALVLSTTPTSIDFLVTGPTVSAADTTSFTLDAPGVDTQLTLFARLDAETAPAASTVIPVVASGSSLTVLVVGDSWTATGTWLDDLVTLAGINYTWVGTQTDAYGNDHEGWSGKGWTWMATHSASPMTSATNTIDIDAYLTALGVVPDVVIWELGINDAFFADVGDIDAGIDTALDDADDLITAWMASAPSVTHAVLTLAAGNELQAAFELNYDPPYDQRTDWRAKQHRYNEMLTDRYCGTSVEIVAMGQQVDPATGYPVNNAIHPDASGYAQVAAAVWEWLAAQ